MSAGPAFAPAAPPAAVHVVPRPPWPSRVLELISAYLPILLMALLALGTWWLVKNTPVAAPPKPQVPLRHEPDYTMSQFVVRRFAADGAMRAQIEGEAMRHYPDTDTLEIDKVRVRALSPDGRVTVATANSALANGDGSEVQLRGGARVVRVAPAGEEPLEFTGEFLHAFLDTERVRSHLPVTVTRGGMTVHAATMEYDNLSRTVQIKGRVSATFPSAAGR